MAAARGPIANDPQRLGAQIDAMAMFLTRVLSLKDPSMMSDTGHVVRDAVEISREERSEPTLAEVMNEEMRYAPSEAQLDLLDELEGSIRFALEADGLSMELLNACGIVDRSGGGEDPETVADPLLAERDGVLISKFVSSAPYFEAEEHARTHGEPIVLGGLGRLLRDEVRGHAFHWLWQCDRTLCIVHHETWEPFDELDELVDQLARDIAKRVTLHARRESVEAPLAEIDHLSSDFLGKRGDQELARSRAASQVEAKNDVRALRALMVIARDGGRTPEAVAVLRDQLVLLQRIVERPPSELGLVGENAKSMNLPLLARVLRGSPGYEDGASPMPLECRIEIANTWAVHRRAYAEPAIAEALRLLESFGRRDARNFINVVANRRGKGGVEMPPASFAPTAGTWYALPAPTAAATRSGLDGHGRRVVRLTSMVWAMAAHHAFEGGVLPTSIVVPCAIETLHHARLMREIVDHERSRCQLGVRILSFEEELDKPSSDLGQTIDVAMCELSQFTLDDIRDVFLPERPLFARIVDALAERTRKQLGNRRTPLVPCEYEHFARDALALLLPGIEARRQALGVGRDAAPHPLADLLRSVRGARSWSPLQGRFVVELADLRRAHPRLREALEHYAVQPSSFVSATHLARTDEGGATKARRRVSFTFESAAMVQLLRM